MANLHYNATEQVRIFKTFNKLGLWKKKDGFISNKNFFQWKIAKDSKFAVQGDWVIESSQIFLNLFFSQVKYMGFFEKDWLF